MAKYSVDVVVKARNEARRRFGHVGKSGITAVTILRAHFPELRQFLIGVLKDNSNSHQEIAGG